MSWQGHRNVTQNHMRLIGLSNLLIGPSNHVRRIEKPVFKTDGQSLCLCSLIDHLCHVFKLRKERKRGTIHGRRLTRMSLKYHLLIPLPQAELGPRASCESRSDIAYGLSPDVLHQHAAVIEVSAQHGVEVFVRPHGLVVDPFGGAAAADFVQEGLHRGEVSFTK